MTILVATVGFDEKFIIRTIIRHSRDLSKIYLVTAEPIDSRAEKALLTIKQFVETILRSYEKEDLNNEIKRDLEVYVYRVNISDFYNSVALIRENCFSSSEAEYVVNLSGGMRALILATLAAFLISNVKGVVEVELENFTDVITIDPRLFKIVFLDEYKRKIIKSIHNRKETTYKDILKDTGIPRATLFRNLKELREQGLITFNRVGRESYYRLTDLGKAFV